MDTLIDLYSAQPFWLWLAIGALLLAVEAAASTEWLLWPAVSAGIVAVVTALGLSLGLAGEVGLFAALTLASTLLSRRLVQRVNPDDQPDINDRDRRLIGQKATVVEPFVDGRGRVFVSGAEWSAELDGDAPLASAPVIVTGVGTGRLTVKAA
ncbi:NfeD family protein [Brevundimonas sp.]|uniref:NfeD family protein n=1 Tax=Brevundimonas sp. TaxID=1871086 RepID=UPI001A1AFE9A|nr:NfeD family protein [Brevundimonas sp.]MBJ7484330.1 NfeD family protein [Brevundimonas sp.]